MADSGGKSRFDTRMEVDFVIIGSGAAGGVIAKELSTAGFDVVVLIAHRSGLLFGTAPPPAVILMHWPPNGSPTPDQAEKSQKKSRPEGRLKVHPI